MSNQSAIELTSTPEQRNQIREFIKDELTKRGFHATLVRFEEKANARGNKTHFSFETESFQTAPVLFKDIKIGEFNTQINKDEENTVDKEIYNLWLSVYVHYTHFGMGTNCSELFSITGHYVKGAKYVHNLIAR